MTKHIHIPLSDVMRLAATLQHGEDTGYGPVLSASQIRRAENIIRRLIKEHLEGKWDHRRR